MDGAVFEARVVGRACGEQADEDRYQEQSCSHITILPVLDEPGMGIGIPGQISA